MGGAESIPYVALSFLLEGNGVALLAFSTKPSLGSHWDVGKGDFFEVLNRLETCSDVVFSMVLRVRLGEMAISM